MARPMDADHGDPVSQGLRFVSPYLDPASACRWMRGNHHGHSTLSDGDDDPLTIVRAYEREGYAYFALSEHDRLVPREELQPHTTMCIIPAVEVTSRNRQTLLYLGADRTLPARSLSAREIMEAVHAAGGLFIFDHPNWQPWPNYAPDSVLDTMEGIQGVEIYTGVIEELSGQARAADRWDYLLSKGWRVWGHGTDDQHDAAGQFVAWNCVQWPEEMPVTPEGIVAALASGRFYASTGVTISAVGTDAGGGRISVESNADEVHWICRGGIILKKERGGSSSFVIEDLKSTRWVADQGPAWPLYVRAECLGHGNACAWTQPFWIAAV